MSSLQESTPLLYKPSACSTDEPSSSRGGYHSLNGSTPPASSSSSYQPVSVADSTDSDEESSPEIELHQTFSNRGFSYLSGTSFHSYLTGKNLTKEERRQRQCRLIVSAMALFALLFGAAVFVFGLVQFPHHHYAKPGMLSELHPVHDLGLAAYERPKGTTPPKALLHAQNSSGKKYFPTNAWYQNMLLLREGEPSAIHRVYTIPFVVDAVGPIPGLRVHPNKIDASTAVIQLNVIEDYALTVGAAPDLMKTDVLDFNHTKRYLVEQMTPLGLTLSWANFPMQSSLVKGMPYGTMSYEKRKAKVNGKTLYPTVAATMKLAGPAIVDRTRKVDCSTAGGSENTSTTHFHVKDEIEMHFYDSDFTWLVFFSEPVVVQCSTNDMGLVSLQVLDSLVEKSTSREDVDDNSSEDPFYIRIALSKLCSTNRNPIFCHQEELYAGALFIGQGLYGDVLRNHSHLIPGPDTKVNYYLHDLEGRIQFNFDWDVRTIKSVPDQEKEMREVLVFALPHHLDLMGLSRALGFLPFYAPTLTGPAILLGSNRWVMNETVPLVRFRASRPPASWSINLIAASLRENIGYKVASEFARGASDTYFPGKAVAKLGRILLVLEEIDELCSAKPVPGVNWTIYGAACMNITLPSKKEREGAVTELRQAVEIWLNGSAAAPFVFDPAWGGVVNCGCNFDEKRKRCRNKFPDCPAFSDHGLNFGNAFFNDLHFHYGYHIYAAAVLSHFDQEWGKKYFEHVLLLVRNIANPEEDDFFPPWRHKDWFSGNSWASGIPEPPYLNGKNQESSSEAIAAYEAVALYGSVMSDIWGAEKEQSKQDKAEKVREAGLALVATEIRAARRYYHVMEKSDDDPVRIYPTEYKHHAVGMLWSTMAQFQTWFGSAPYLALGIQLLPLTPIAEMRDGLEWSKEMYPSYSDSCNADPTCTENGWSILQVGILATVGHPQLAAQAVEAMPESVFQGAGGGGHSRTNTLWFLATRPVVDEPLALRKQPFSNRTTKHNIPELRKEIDCFKPITCTDYVLDTIADEYSCRQRITFLMNQLGETEYDACLRVASMEFPQYCGGCNPQASSKEDFIPTITQCPPCTPDECSSKLNRCPEYTSTFVCTKGPSHGGCRGSPWDLLGFQCTACCELTQCPKLPHGESNCPPCSKDICRTKEAKECPPSEIAPYLCTEGFAEGGCSVVPWVVDGLGQCTECCKILPGCDE